MAMDSLIPRRRYPGLYRSCDYVGRCRGVRRHVRRPWAVAWSTTMAALPVVVAAGTKSPNLMHLRTTPYAYIPALWATSPPHSATGRWRPNIAVSHRRERSRFATTDRRTHPETKMNVRNMCRDNEWDGTDDPHVGNVFQSSDHGTVDDEDDDGTNQQLDAVAAMMEWSDRDLNQLFAMPSSSRSNPAANTDVVFERRRNVARPSYTVDELEAHLAAHERQKQFDRYRPQYLAPASDTSTRPYLDPPRTPMYAHMTTSLNQNHKDDDNDIIDPGGAVFLDSDTYSNARKMVQADGSLSPDRAEFSTDTSIDSINDQGLAMIDYQALGRKVSIPVPLAPPLPEDVMLSSTASSSSSPPLEPKEQDLLNAWQRHQQQLLPDFTAIATTHSSDPRSGDLSQRAEVLHQRVFESEQGFLAQSDVFRESLTDQSKADGAKSHRRRQDTSFHRRNSAAISDLARMLGDFERDELPLMLQQMTQRRQQLAHQPDMSPPIPTTKPSQPFCAQCLCAMSEEEYRLATPRKVEYQRLCPVCYGEILAGPRGNLGPYMN